MPHNTTLKNALNLHQFLAMGDGVVDADVKLALRIVHLALLENKYVNMGAYSGQQMAKNHLAHKIDMSIPYGRVLFGIQNWWDAGFLKPGHVGSPSGQVDLLNILLEVVRVTQKHRSLGLGQEFRFFIRIDANPQVPEQIITGLVTPAVDTLSDYNDFSMADFLDGLKSLYP